VHSETDASFASSGNCRHWATGLGGRQAAHSRPSDQRRRTPDGRACCDDVVVRKDGGSWKIEVADDWQCLKWGGSSSRGTGKPCLGDTGELSIMLRYGRWRLSHCNDMVGRREGPGWGDGATAPARRRTLRATWRNNSSYTLELKCLAYDVRIYQNCTN